MITLPTPPTPNHLRGFGTSMAVAAASVGAVAGWIAANPGWAGLGAALGLAAGGSAWAWPHLAEGPYRLWNAGADLLRRALRLILTGVCFAIVSAAGRAGTRLPWEARGADASGWRPRSRGDRGDGWPPRADGQREPIARGWVGRYWAWARGTDNLWAVALLPYLWLLRTLRSTERGSLDEQIYTLF